MAICGYLPLVAHLISLMILTASRNRADCSPASPFLFPAIERFWQGEPKVITSIGSISAPLILVMSPRWAMFGKRDWVTAIGNGSISLAHAGMIPTAEAARGHVPLPSNRLPSFMFPSLFVGLPSPSESFPLLTGVLPRPVVPKPANNKGIVPYECHLGPSYSMNLQPHLR